MGLEPALHSPATGVVVTGGASGIGLATARALAAVGRPVALWDIQAERAAKCAAEIAREFGVRAAGLGADLRDPGAIAPAVAGSRAALGPIGGLVHAAGTVEITWIEGVTPENWDAGMNVHLRPLILITQALLPELRSHRGSAVVGIASMNATVGNGMIPIYSAAKGGMLSLVRSMADDLARHGIRINALSPGVIRTPIVETGMGEEGIAVAARRALLQRVGQPEEIGRAARFLLSDEASYITAAEIVVDGGSIGSQRI